MDDTYLWYQQLVKPVWAPPSWLFAPVWTVLYLIIFVSFGTVFLTILRKKIPQSIALPFILNIVTNALFTPLQFGLRNNILAFIDIVFVLITLVWSMRVIYRKIPWVAYVNIPYLLWVTFATCLQFTITLLNI